MAPYPEEIDVFTVPHSRMKQLVDVYCEKLTCTDFADYLALEALLSDLHNTFCEFKSHEQIENKYIMKKLKQRLKSLSIHDAAVCNCHSDNRLSDILALLEDGYSCSSKPESERINFGLKLQNALQEFTGVFLPHMREEEEVFQPMLIKYFEYEELKCLKEQVIQEHSKWCTFDFEIEKVTLEESADCKYDRDKDIHEEPSFELPPEVLSLVFNFLSPQEIIKCSEVCHSWYEVSRNPVLWKELYPCYWAHGIWDHYDSNPEDMLERLYPKSPYPPRYYQDEDADIDELWESEDGNLEKSNCSDEKRINLKEMITLNNLIKFLLPRVGTGVQKIVLSSCRGLTSSQLRDILILCPNVIYLDVSYTSIADSSFKCLKDYNSCLKLQHVDFSGCIGISDLGLFRLADSIAVLPPVLPDGSSDLREVYLENCDHLNSYCPCSHNSASFCQEIEDSGHFFQRTQRDVIFDDCTSLCTSICAWKRNGFMCHLARQVQQCPYINSCLYSNRFDISKATSDILRTTSAYCRNVRSDVSSDNESNRPYGEVRLPSLRFLNLSGCEEITDDGLRCLVEAGLFEMLGFLDVSGCWQLTGPGLCSMIEFAPQLRPENIYYCNQIEDGPYPETANGCQNLESDMRACCCNRMS